MVWEIRGLRNELKQKDKLIYSLKIDCAVRDSVLKNIQRWNNVLINESADSISSYIRAEKIKRLKNF